MSELYETLENNDTELGEGEMIQDADEDATEIRNTNDLVSSTDSTEGDKNLNSEENSIDTLAHEDLVSVKEEIQAAHIEQLINHDQTTNVDKLKYEKKHEISVTKIINSQSEPTPYQEVITVKFLTENGETFASAFKLSCKVKEVKDKIASALNTDYNTIKLEKDGYCVDDWLPLSGLGVEPLGSLELKVTSSDPCICITSAAISDYIPTVDVITVHVSMGCNLYKDVIVEIENQCLHKEWLGGYRNKKTNLEYHHACTQTLPKKYQVYIQSENGEVIPRLFERETQTALPLRNIGTETLCNRATRMYTSDQYIPLPDDKIVSPKHFETYEEWCEKNDVEKKVITIQRAFREWSKCLKERKMNKYYEVQRNVFQSIKDEKISMLTEQVKKKRKTMSGSVFPSSRDDFYMLYLMVGKWWKKEWQRIQELRTEEARKAEYIALLEKEITLLSAIEKHRIEAKEESLRKDKMRFLDVTSQPTVFRSTNGIMTSIENPDTQKAREFKEMYCTLIRTDLTMQERIEVLLTLKNLMLQNNGYEFSNNLITLIEREIDLLAIGCKDKELVGLRKRIEQFFMDFLQKPQFNPKAGTYRKHIWSKQSAANLYKCKRCLKMLPPSRFPVHSRMPSISVCKSCDWLQNIGHERTDMSPYLKMLKQVQYEEMQQSSYSSICFVLQQTGMYFLTNIIWHGHSAISEQRNISKLTMVRWLNNVEWSPWNTILLTQDEAKCQASINNVYEFYDKAFINSVHQKHILARIHFLPLLKTAHNLQSTSDWQKIQESVYVNRGQISQLEIQEDKVHDYSIKDILGQKKNKAIEALLSEL